MDSLTNIIRKIKWRRLGEEEKLALKETRRSAYRVLVKKTEGKIQLGKPRCLWEDNIKMSFQEVGWECGLD